jgi:hypothetical protein
MKQLTINTASYLLIGLLGATGLILSLVSIGKASRRSHRLRSFMKDVVWSALAILCLSAIVLSPTLRRRFEPSKWSHSMWKP